MLVAQHEELIVDITNVVVGPLITYVHSSRTPPGEVLDLACDRAESSFDLTNVRILVLTDGGTPSPVARKKLVNRLRQFSDSPQVAVISDAPVMRFVISNLMLFNPNAKVFSPRDLGSALAFLRVSPEDARQIASMLCDLRVENGDRFRALDACVRSMPHPMT